MDHKRQICLFLLLTLLGPMALADGWPTRSQLSQLPGSVDLPEELHALAFGSEGALAFAIPRPHKERIGSTVEIHDGDIDGLKIDTDLRIRDLIWLKDGRLLAVAFRAARRTQGESFLLLWDPARVRFKRLMHLPPTARDLTYGHREDVLLLTTRNELRTLRLPSLRSGPLYRVLGENRSALVVDGSRVLVGQSDALLLVDLNDRQSRERMPVREHLAVASPVEQIFVDPEGTAVRVALLDGSVHRVQFDPLAMVVDGMGAGSSALAVPDLLPRVQDESETPDREAPPLIARLELRSEQDAPPPTIDGADPTEPPASSPTLLVAPSDEPQPPVTDSSQIHGRLTGPGSSAVLAVVAFGPDSVLREATRIVPDGQGGFEFGELPAGRYRIQLDGGGGKLLVSEPAFHIVDVEGDSSARIEFRVLRAL